MANKLGQEIGRGSYRTVYHMKDKKVVKIVGTRFAHDDLGGDFYEEAFDQNEVEAGNMIDSEFEEILPEVEKGGEDYAWIIMEKINVCQGKGSSKCIVDLFPNIDEDSFPDYFFDDPTPYKCVNAIRDTVKNCVSKDTLHPARESVLEDSELL